MIVPLDLLGLVRANWRAQRAAQVAPASNFQRLAHFVRLLENERRPTAVAQNQQGNRAMQPTPEQVAAGQAVYTKRTLAAYDLVVIRISNRYIWQCPSTRIEALYNEHVSANHLDVGVGTGYFLDQCRFPVASPRIALMDLNADTLDFAAARVARYNPTTHCQNILAPIDAELPGFDSIGVNYLLHCLPGSIAEKAVIFDHLKPFMNPGATIFGSTILQGGVPSSWLAQRLMAFYNTKGIFSNQADQLDDLEQALRQRFTHVSIHTVGSVALFAAR